MRETGRKLTDALKITFAEVSEEVGRAVGGPLSQVNPRPRAPATPAPRPDRHVSARVLSSYLGRALPVRSARSTARARSTRVETPILLKMLRRCVSTVFWLRNSSAAI